MAITLEQARENLRREVIYTPPGGKPERGTIEKVTDDYVFVLYLGDRWAKATSPWMLDWAPEDEAGVPMPYVEFPPGAAQFFAGTGPPVDMSWYDRFVESTGYSMHNLVTESDHGVVVEVPEHCPGSDDPRCKSECTIDTSDNNRIVDPDCFR